MDAALPSLSPQAFSAWTIFVQADWVVKLVILVLVGSSFWSWAIIFAKTVRFSRLRVLTHTFERHFWSSKTLDGLYDRISKNLSDPLTNTFCAAMAEWRRSKSAHSVDRDRIQERVERVMQVRANRELENLEKHMGFLASLGSTAPFIGLFGTVWGIMRSFEAIGASQSTSLVVVAPAIAEALFATALGLVAAIPAVVAYHKLSTDISRYENRLETFVKEFGTVLARQERT